ncbi:hypothetical protein D3C80_1647470 [compost metagenome]
MPRTHLREYFREALELTGQVARIDRYGDLRMQQFGILQGALRQFGEQAGRQVVDAVEAVVLKDIEGGAFAGAGAAADDDQAHGQARLSWLCTSTTT